MTHTHTHTVQDVLEDAAPHIKALQLGRQKHAANLCRSPSLIIPCHFRAVNSSAGSKTAFSLSGAAGERVMNEPRMTSLWIRGGNYSGSNTPFRSFQTRSFSHIGTKSQRSITPIYELRGRRKDNTSQGLKRRSTSYETNDRMIFRTVLSEEEEQENREKALEAIYLFRFVCLFVHVLIYHIH